MIESIKDFECGFFNLMDENVGKTLTVKLRMSKPDYVNDPFSALLPDYIDVAVIRYEIKAPSAENLQIVIAYLTDHPELYAYLA